jgi:hypothetical protein
MAERFDRLASRSVGTTRTRVGAYTVPVNKAAIVIGSSIANRLDAEVTVTLEHGDGTAFTMIARAVTLAQGQTLAPSGEMNKLVLRAGDSLHVTASAADAVDAVISILEIDA